MTHERLPLVLDLDGTLLHPDPLPGATAIPGRTRPAYMARESILALRRMSPRFAIIVATARSWAGTRPVVAALGEAGVPISGLVLEDGALWGRTADALAPTAAFDGDALRRALEAVALPSFAWQEDFQACLVARAPDAHTAITLAPLLARGARAKVRGVRCFRDGRKVYLMAGEATKWAALRRLLGERADLAAGVGDGLNDVVWLARAAFPCTLAGARPGVLRLVAARGGHAAIESAHRGIVEALAAIAARFA